MLETREIDPNADVGSPPPPPPSSTPGPDFGALIVGSGDGKPGSIPDDVQKGYGGILEREQAEHKRIADDSVGTLKRDRDTASRWLEAEGHDIDSVKPWDADQERRKYETDPIESFGSIGSAFAMIASAFTRQPMLNALNGGAAAMNAIKQGNDKEFQRAYQAWKDNNDLVIKRHGMMHQQYQDALSLMDKDMLLGRAQFEATAHKFGDEKAIFLNQHGMNKELIDLMTSRDKAMEQNLKIRAEFDDELINRNAIQQRINEVLKDATPEERARIKAAQDKGPQAMIAAMSPEHKKAVAQAMEDWQVRKQSKGRPLTNDQQAFQDFRRANPNATPEQEAEYIRSLKPQRETNDQRALAQFYEDHADDHDGKGPNAQEVAAYMATLPKHGASAGGNTNLTIQRQAAAARKEEYDKVIAAGGTKEDAEKAGNEKYRSTIAGSTPVPPGKAVDLRLMIGQLGRISGKIDDIEKMMVKYGMLTGLGGTLRRPAETLIDILGGDTTAAKEFNANLKTLQQWVSQRIDNKLASGRPLSAADLRMQDIVPGLKIGDTVQFTAKQLRTLQKDILDMKREDEEILNSQTPGSTKPPADSSGKIPAWKRLGVPSGE